MTLDKGDHVIFEAREIIGKWRHKRIGDQQALYPESASHAAGKRRLENLEPGKAIDGVRGRRLRDQQNRPRPGPTGEDAAEEARHPYATLLVSKASSDPLMLLSKEYVGYLAREVSKKLLAGEFIVTKNTAAVGEKVHAAMLEEFSLEDRINDEVRVILEAYSDEMRKTGANYQEMFRKVKTELVRKYKAVL